ncbi:hypothetical protein Q8W40_24035 [Vibrio penaeicida]|uniref:hypothetical protein n=1 Tax=Vibrio penaeicida TaxID=104609 RepID=UPI00273609F8|nr:hypothetical protein [Vibrio penaeicida]MDP2575288.1 hypothetical protein [Vibrio penaeicida]
MFGQGTSQVNTFDITEIGHIERVVVGTTDPGNIPTESETNKQMAFVNRCLNDFPKGRIIGNERSFTVVRIGEHQVVLESIAYHIGFKKAPQWLVEQKNAEPEFAIDPQKVDDIISKHIE